MLGEVLGGGETIELISDLGGGKTTFVRGIAQGIGSADHVSSPSFTINNQYGAASLRLYHYDFYRLHDPGLIAAEMAEVLHDKKNIVVIEWGGLVDTVLPDKRLRIKIVPTAEMSRQFSFEYSTQYGTLLNALRRRTV